MTEESESRILIVGVGNLLLGDEGVGIHAVRELEKRSLPAYVHVVDGGTAGLNLLDLMIGHERVIIIDAVDGGAQPGTLYRFSPQEIAEDVERLPLSLHQMEVLNVLQLATYLGQPLPPIVVYGIQPETIDWSTELSATLRSRMEGLLHAVLNEVSETAR
ncbi:MAG: hydrogenase maturation protease [Anaerolineae bacterium]|nr:hydrogenase maturation protease [Anaerolineae bacterium]NIN95935.1 hydrogenase maturation protease [Anaerolineae bacterium]NIQ78899.1 hydrogenase maturation protease [Anaerolineae bacterium]